MPIRYLILLICCLLPCLPAQAGNTREDSLLRVLATLPQDTQRVLTYNELFKATFTSAPQRALDYGQRALRLSRDLAYTRGIARLSNNLGVWHSKQGHYQQSLQYYASARVALANLGDSVGSIDCEMNIGSVYYKMGQYDQALQQYDKALRDYKVLQDTSGMLAAINNMGSVLKERGNYPGAMKAYMAALQIRERLGDPVQLGLSYANVGTIYQQQGMLEPAQRFFMRSLALAQQGDDQFGRVAALTSLADIAMEQGELTRARPMLDSAIAIATRMGDQEGLGGALLSRSILQQRVQQQDSALAGFNAALAIFRDMGSTQSMAKTLSHLGELHLRQGAVAQAEAALRESLVLSDSLSTPDLSRDNHRLLADLYDRRGDHTAAYYHLSRYTALHDTLYSKEKARQILEIRSRYETTKQLEEINRLNLQATQDQLRIAKSSWRNLILLAILLPAVLLAAIFYLRYAQKQRHNRRIDKKNEEIQQQRDLLEAQNRQIREINTGLERMVEQRTQALRLAHKELDTFLYESAHALRRPLTRIQGLEELIGNEQDPTMRERLRGQLRITLAGMDELLHKLIQVSEAERRGLQLEHVSLHAVCSDIISRQPSSVDVHFHFPEDYTIATDEYLLRALLGVILENAYRFMDLGSREQRIDIRASHDEAIITLEVEDNGTGMDADTLNKAKEMFFRGSNHRGGHGLGLYIASKVMDQLHGTLTLTSVPKQGTKVAMIFPRQEI